MANVTLVVSYIQHLCLWGKIYQLTYDSERDALSRFSLCSIAASSALFVASSFFLAMIGVRMTEGTDYSTWELWSMVALDFVYISLAVVTVVYIGYAYRILGRLKRAVTLHEWRVESRIARFKTGLPALVTLFCFILRATCELISAWNIHYSAYMSFHPLLYTAYWILVEVLPLALTLFMLFTIPPPNQCLYIEEE